jgi:hypothetical protein
VSHHKSTTPSCSRWRVNSSERATWKEEKWLEPAPRRPRVDSCAPQTSALKFTHLPVHLVLQVKPRAEPTTLYAKGKILGYKRYATQAALAKRLPEMGHGLRGAGGGARCEVAATSFLNSLLPPLAGARPTSTRTRRSSRSSTSTRRRTLTSTWASGATASPDARAACSRARAMVASAMRRCGTSGDDGTAAAERASDSMRNSVPLVAQRSRRRHHLDAAGSYGVAVRYCHSGVTAVTAAAGQQQPQKQPPQEPHLQRGSLLSQHARTVRTRRRPPPCDPSPVGSTR